MRSLNDIPPGHVRHADVAVELAAGRERQQIVEAAALPNTKMFRRADLEVRELRVQLEGLDRERSTTLGGIDSLTRVRDALFHWRCWAEGRPVPADVIVDAVEALRDQRMIKSAHAETLLEPLELWCKEHGIRTPPPAIQPERAAIQPAPVTRGPELDIGL